MTDAVKWDLSTYPCQESYKRVCFQIQSYQIFYSYPCPRMEAGSVKDQELSGLLGKLKLPASGSGRYPPQSMPLAPKLGDDFRHLQSIRGGSSALATGSTSSSSAAAETAAKRQQLKPPPHSSLIIPTSSSQSHGLPVGAKYSGQPMSPASGLTSPAPGMSRYHRV